MTIQNQEIKEVKASFGVNAEVADAIDKKAVSPGKVQKNGDQESESIPQGSSLPKTKISMINAKSGLAVYEVTVRSEGAESNLAKLMPYLIESALQDFPGKSGTPRVITLPVKK